MDARPRSQVRSVARYTVAVLGLILAYFVAGWLGFALASEQPNVSAVWPAAGVATSALACFGRRLWPAIWIGAFLVNISQSGDLGSSLGIACGNTASNLVGAWFLVRYGRARAFEKVESLVGFMCGTGLFASGIAATVGTASLALMGRMTPEPVQVVWLSWWLGDAVSVWLLVPVLILGGNVLASLRARRIRFRPRLMVEYLGAILVLVAGSILSFGGLLPEPLNRVPTGFSNLPSLFWLALRFGPLGTSAGLIIHCVISVWGTNRGYGSYAGIPDEYLLLQLYLGIRVFIFQFLAVLIAVYKRTNADLRASELRIQDIIDSVPGVVWETQGNPGDPDYRLTFVSHQVENLFGYAPAEWLSNPDLIWGAIHPEDQPRVREQAAKDFARYGNSTSQLRILTKDGKMVDVELRMTALKDLRGRPMGMRGFTMDISDRKRAEALLLEAEQRLRQSHKMEAVGRVSGGLAHDFNNLLTTINGYNELILDASSSGDGSIADYARQIRIAGNRAANLTHQLLTFSRQDVVQTQVFDLNGLVADRERWLVSLLREGIHLGLTLEPGPLEVRADPSQIERVLTNLVLNARDAMPDGGVITITTSRQGEPDRGGGFSLEPGPGPHVVLSVADTGVGIPEELMDRLFEPFFTTKKESRSMGLGLPTVYGILERSGGGIRIASRVGEGARFEVFLLAYVNAPVHAGSA